MNKTLKDENTYTSREKTSDIVLVDKVLKDENLDTMREET
jgi:hypothetical protein